MIGQRTEIYGTDHNGQLAFLVIPHEDRDYGVQRPRVSKPSLETDVEARFSALESELIDLKLLISQNGSSATAKNKKQAPESGFEPESEPRQGSMIGRYTTRAHASAALKRVTAY